MHQDDTSYDYDYGLYIDCTVFDVVVHAPITDLCADTMLELDFDAAKTDDMVVKLSDDDNRGRIFNIDATEFTLTTQGTTELELSGQVSGTADMNLYHDSHIDARKLSAEKWDTMVSRGIGGFSYILRDQWYLFECASIDDATNTLEFFVFAPLILWIWLEIKCIKKLRKPCQKTDEK